MRALVTGCAGFIGSHLCEALVAAGHEVAGIDAFTGNYPAVEKRHNLARLDDVADFELHEVDLAEDPLEALVEDRDAVFHLAGEPGVPQSWGDQLPAYLRNNVVSTHRLLDALARRPGARLVLSSSSSIYGEAATLPTPESARPAPLSPYGATKLAAEEACALYRRVHAVPSVILRFFSVYGPRQRPDMAMRRFCEAALDGRPVRVVGDGSQTRDFTYVGDIVPATVAAAAAAGVVGGTYNLGGGGHVSVAGIVGLLGEIAGRLLAVEHVPAQPGEPRATGAETARAREDLGFQPLTGVREGLGAQLAWLEHARSAAVAAD